MALIRLEPGEGYDHTGEASFGIKFTDPSFIGGYLMAALGAAQSARTRFLSAHAPV
jgi:hypothetical protein